MWITRVSINNPVFATMVMVGIAVLGLFAYNRLRVEQVPDVSLPYVLVLTSYPGASPEVVEGKTITSLNRPPWVSCWLQAAIFSARIAGRPSVASGERVPSAALQYPDSDRTRPRVGGGSARAHTEAGSPPAPVAEPHPARRSC